MLNNWLGKISQGFYGNRKRQKNHLELDLKIHRNKFPTLDLARQEDDLIKELIN